MTSRSPSDEAQNLISSMNHRACDSCRNRKIRCDRLLPTCDNCRHSSLQCVYSDRAKRMNQVKRLSESLGEIENRLLALEEANESSSLYARLEAVEKKLMKQNRPATYTKPTELSFLNAQDDAVFDATTALPELHHSSAPDSHHVALGENGIENLHGSSSMLLLVRDAGLALEQRLLNQPPPDTDSSQDHYMNVYARLSQSCQEAFRPFIHSDYTDLSHDNQPMTLPPEGLVRTLVQPFFEQINPIFPTFESSNQVEEYIQKAYTDTDDRPDIALYLILNCVTLHSLSAKYRNTPQDTNEKNMDSELLKPFLINLRRAFRDTNQMLKPRIMNVQALASFCLFALDNFQIEVAELLMEHASHCAKAMGLHRQGPFSPTTSGRKNLFWSLFVLDKIIFFLTGKPFTLPSYDCGVPLPYSSPSSSADISERMFLARISLARIQERIYINLYSAQATCQSANSHKVSVHQMEQDLQQWLIANQPLLSNSDVVQPSHPCYYIGPELLTLHGMCLIMVIRFNIDPSGDLKCLNEARATMARLQSLDQQAELRGKEAALRRIFEFCPFVAFLEIFSRLLKYPRTICVPEDTQLLSRAVDILRSVSKADHASTYCSKILCATIRCYDLCMAVIQQANSCPTRRKRKRRLEQQQQPTELATLSEDWATQLSTQSSNALSTYTATNGPLFTTSPPQQDSLPSLFLSPGIFSSVNDLEFPNPFSEADLSLPFDWTLNWGGAEEDS